ncbi:type VII secretion system ESX-2 subunit EccB2, partial [Mycobacterium tuberculosis]
WVNPAEIAKYPTGPLVGIPGAPAAMPVNRGAVSAWAVCDTAGRPRSADKPVVTSIAGPITGGGRATHLRDDAGLLVTFDGSTYVIWGGKRSQIDPTNRAVTLSLGLDPGVTSPIQISRALFDGLPATEPLRVPAVPEAGTPSTWVPGARVGSVLQAQTAGGGSQFYVLLPDGVQKISSFVADLLRSANSYGAAAPRVVTPDVLVHTPQVTSLPVEYYPAGRLNFVDTAADPTTCVSWEKASTDPQARVAVYNGRGLPVPPSMDSRIVRLVRDDRAPASVVATQVLVLPGAANFVTSTSGVITAESRESLFWVSGNGVRFGIANDEATLRALGLDPGAAVQAPWPLLRTFAAGPALSRDAALLARDTVPTLGQVAIVTTTAKAGA